MRPLFSTSTLRARKPLPFSTAKPPFWRAHQSHRQKKRTSPCRKSGWQASRASFTQATYSSSGPRKPCAVPAHSFATTPQTCGQTIMTRCCDDARPDSGGETVEGRRPSRHPQPATIHPLTTRYRVAVSPPVGDKKRTTTMKNFNLGKVITTRSINEGVIVLYRSQPPSEGKRIYSTVLKRKNGHYSEKIDGMTLAV